MKLPINYRESHWTVRKQARLQYVEEQKGKCLHCGNPLEGDPVDEVKMLILTLLCFPLRC